MSVADPLVLIVEDDAMLVISYEMAVEDAGYRHVVATTLEEGMAAASTEIDTAILDIRLGSQLVFPVARKLEALGVPFLFCSGTISDIPQDDFADTLLLSKPISPFTVLDEAIKLIDAESA